jgi:hypothetical protein
MHAMHPDLRTGLAEEHVRRLRDDRRAPSSPGPTRRFASHALLAAANWLAGEQGAPAQASSASFTSLSASSLSSRRTAV